MRGVGFYMLGFTHATHLDKHGFSQLSGPLNPQQADFRNVRQDNDWVFFSVRREAG